MTLDNRPVLTFGPACAEPSLEGLLADPIIRLLMAQDRVSDATRRALASHIRPGCLSGPKAQDDLTRNAIGADQLVLEVAP
jgi:hypothetical protein